LAFRWRRHTQDEDDQHHLDKHLGSTDRHQLWHSQVILHTCLSDKRAKTYIDNVRIVSCAHGLECRFYSRFLPHNAMLSAVYSVVLCVCVCVCVCVSVTLRYCIKTAKRRIKQIFLTIASWLYFSDTKVNGEIRTGSPPTGATNAGGVG